MPRDRFGQLTWRPRVPSLLPREKEEEIRKNLKEYSRRYDEEDEALLLQVRFARATSCDTGCACRVVYLSLALYGSDGALAVWYNVRLHNVLTRCGITCCLCLHSVK
jgi:hypothetical protein